MWRMKAGFKCKQRCGERRRSMSVTGVTEKKVNLVPKKMMWKICDL